MGGSGWGAAPLPPARWRAQGLAPPSSAPLLAGSLRPLPIAGLGSRKRLSACGAARMAALLRVSGRRGPGDPRGWGGPGRGEGGRGGGEGGCGDGTAWVGGR